MYYTVKNHNQQHHENIDDKLIYALKNYEYSKTNFNYGIFKNYKNVNMVGVLFKMIMNKNKIKVRVFLIINADKIVKGIFENKKDVIYIPVTDENEEEQFKNFLFQKGLIENTSNETQLDVIDEQNTSLKPPQEQGGKNEKPTKEKTTKKEKPPKNVNYDFAPFFKAIFS
jgi:hypothetical protein